MKQFQPPQRRADAITPADETIVWTGAPPTGFRLRASDALAIPFSLFWGGFSIFWELFAVEIGAPWFFALWGIPFVAIGLYLMVGRFFVDAYLRSRTTYTITNRAVYITRLGAFPAVRRYAGGALDTTEFQLRANGTGTIRFGRPGSPFTNSRAGWMFWNGASFDSLDGIPDPQRVYGFIVAARTANGGGR